MSATQQCQTGDMRRSSPGPRAVLCAALTLALALGACASISGPVAAVDAGVVVPADWHRGSSAAEPTQLAAWWRRLDDPALTALVEQALVANTSVASAQAALRQARALAQVQQARLGPSVGSSASAQRSRTEAGTGNSFRAGLDASWEWDLFGGQQAARDAADRDAQAAAATLGDVRVSLAAEVALAYIELRSSEQRLVIARDNLASQQETLQITQWRVQAGLASSLQAEQARTAVEQTRAQLPAFEVAIAQLRHQLALLTGRPVAGFVLPSGGAVPQPADTLALAFPAETLRQRADVRAAEARVQAATGRAAQAEAARLPSFNLGGSLGLSALTLSGLGSASPLVSVLAGFSWPVFDGGALRAQSQAQQAALDQARASYRAAVLGALKDVEDALVALQGDRERLGRLRDAAEAAANAALLARQRYASGLVDFQTVLETQRTLLGAQDNVARGVADVASDHVSLYKALGGGWTPRTDRDEPNA